MRVAVLGAGYAGLTLARKLQNALPDEATLVVVDESDSHLVQHELHRAVRRPALAEEITIPLEDVLDCEIRQARVTDVNPAEGTAMLDSQDGEDDDGHGEERLDYDVGAVCLGAETDDHGLPGVADHGTPLKSLAHAREIRAEYLDVLDADGRVIVGGAGLSGVQLAGELAAMADDRGADSEILLLERLDAVAPSFPGNFQRAVRDELERAGVDVRTGTAVESADADAVTLATGDELAYDQFVWTGGIRGPDAMDAERPVVRSDLRLAGDTFVVGDAGRVVDVDGEAVPASAQTAVRQARVAARNITVLVDHRLGGGGGFAPELDRYEFDSPGWLVSVGDGAVAQVGSRVLTGRAALALKTSVGAGYLGSVGAVENAVDLVREELNLTVEADESESESAEGNGNGDA
ncbi:NADH dehydrogenase [Halomicrobium zhouii]|uniref:NADH dehydrogenase n=1 Tax=Halomicrobium zhouii TaxID=767519 RepID=A0A1I6KSS1_9EURY|nr:FAD-dependent oxidoreductase [Halomicrobium zhouii]SFR94247.1 NADH dehydrogenase [Halomicrobium zhouii]